MVVDQLLDRAQLERVDGGEVREVEPQPPGVDEGAVLAGAVAQRAPPGPRKAAGGNLGRLSRSPPTHPYAHGLNHPLARQGHMTWWASPRSRERMIASYPVLVDRDHLEASRAPLPEAL
jgi:hypothetical protein